MPGTARFALAPIAALAFAAAALTLAAPPGLAMGERTPRGGLTGTVTRGPITPVCRQGIPCDEPASGLTLLFVRRGAVPARARTDGHGRYRVALAAGRYTIRTATPTTIGRGVSPVQVTVPSHRFARVDLFLDTGIR